MCICVVVTHRQKLHSIPELGGQEVRRACVHVMSRIGVTCPQLLYMSPIMCRGLAKHNPYQSVPTPNCCCSLLLSVFVDTAELRLRWLITEQAVYNCLAKTSAIICHPQFKMSATIKATNIDLKKCHTQEVCCPIIRSSRRLPRSRRRWMSWASSTSEFNSNLNVLR